MSLPYPPPLPPGGTLGIVSPSGKAKPEEIKAGAKLLEERGYRVGIHPQNSMENGPLAGSDEARAKALMEMFADPKIDAILCARGGGIGSFRLVDKLDYELIKANPKPFIGFSEITSLVQSISARSGFVTYHGPMCAWLGREHDPRTLDDMLAATGSDINNFVIRSAETKCLRPGTAEGRLVGGNMTVLQNLIATPYDWSTNDAILFIEDTDEVLYKTERTLRHFRMAGKFLGVRAVLVGEMVDCVDGETGFMRAGEKPYGIDWDKVLKDNIPDVPICTNFPCGHSKYLTTLPVGAHAKLILDASGVELRFPQP